MNSLRKKIFHSLTVCLLLGFWPLASLAQLPPDTTQIEVRDSLLPDSNQLPPMPRDSVVKKRDTLIISNDALEEEVRTSAVDSMVFDIPNKMVYLYGEVKIDYKDLHLEANNVVIDWEKNEMRARAKLDSNGKVIQDVVLEDKGRNGQADSLAYNFKSRRGKIYGFRTKEGSGYVHVANAKKNEDDVLYCKDAKYTTCNERYPHFWLQLKKAKIIPNDKVITSYAYFVVEGIEIYPLAVPFGFFPTNTQKASSGILFPNYGFSPGRGYFLQNGGYYFALSDKYDLSLTGDIYSYGSWGVGARSNYKVRYKYSGNAELRFNRNFFDNGQGEFEPTNDFKISWTHRQDPKSIPGMTFSANVNAGTSTFNRNNSTNVNEIFDSRLRSSINFSKSFGSSPFRMSVSLNHNQNIQTNSLQLSLPKTNVSMTRINPFSDVRNKNLKWLRNIGISHILDLENRVNTTDSLLFDPDTTVLWDRGISHTLPINTSFNVFKWFSVNPSFRYRGYVSFYETEKYFDTTENRLISDRHNALSYSFDYQFSTSIKTQVYGMFRFRRSKKIEAIRHMMTPSISFNYTPDFTHDRWGYYREVPGTRSENTEPQLYNRFENNPLGSPTRGQIGSIGFNLGNIVEMKVNDFKDTTKKNATKKIKILESLSANSNYNFFADSMNLSDLNLRARTRLFNSIQLNSSARLSPYVETETGRRINQYRWEAGEGFLLLQNFNFNVGTSLKDNMIRKWLNGGKKADEVPGKGIITQPNSKYQPYKFPFDLRVTYDYTVRRTSGEYDPTQTLRLAGSFQPTNKWRVSYTLNYDVEGGQISGSNFSFVRDLHCWEFSFDWIPTGVRKSFFFSLRARASELNSLKIEKNSFFYDN